MFYLFILWSFFLLFSVFHIIGVFEVLENFITDFQFYWSVVSTASIILFQLFIHPSFPVSLSVCFCGVRVIRSFVAPDLNRPGARSLTPSADLRSQTWCIFAYYNAALFLFFLLFWPCSWEPMDCSFSSIILGVQKAADKLLGSRDGSLWNPVGFGSVSSPSEKAVVLAVLWPSPALLTGCWSHRPTQLLGISTLWRKACQFSCWGQLSLEVSYRKWNTTSLTSN